MSRFFLLFLMMWEVLLGYGCMASKSSSLVSPASSSPKQILVPFYVYPSENNPEYQKLWDIPIPSHTNVIIILAAPSSGDANYQNIIPALQSKGYKVYLQLNLADPSWDQAMDTLATHYGNFDGFYLVGDWNDLAKVQQAHQEAQQLQKGIIVAAGQITPSSYLSISDAIMSAYVTVSDANQHLNYWQAYPISPKECFIFRQASPNNLATLKSWLNQLSIRCFYIHDQDNFVSLSAYWSEILQW